MKSPPSTALHWRTLLQMTRPGFLVITAVACVLGTAVAVACGHGPNVWTALATLVLAVLMHATPNVLNDYTPQEKNRAQAAINFCVFSTMAFTSFASGALVTTQGWTWLNWGSLVPVLLTSAGLLWLARKKASAA